MTDQVDDITYLELSHPDIKQKFAKLLSVCVDAGVISFASVCTMLDEGNAHPLGLQLLQNLAENKGISWLKEHLSANNVTCTQLIPGE